MEDLKETSSYDELGNRIVVRTEYDNRAVLAANAAALQDMPEHGRYRGQSFAHVGRIHMGDVTRLKNLGYNLLSPDPDEVKRALLYIQSNERAMLTVPGTPIAKRKQQWV
jgi:hypothetical protein